MSDWQPIETAPKDGTLVLVADADGYMAIARRYEDAPDDWTDADGLDFSYGDWRPTHWMPLPAKPLPPKFKMKVAVQRNGELVTVTPCEAFGHTQTRSEGDTDWVCVTCGHRSPVMAEY